MSNSKVTSNKPILHAKYINTAIPKLMEEFNYKSVMQVPKIEKVTINIGIGEALKRSSALQAAINDLQKIAAQKPIQRKAKKSISNFSLRAGQVIGVSTTLRKNKMWYFLDRFLNIALPRTRDFRGISAKKIDGQGNISIGILEQIVFPEIKYNEIDKLRGLQVSITTSTKNRDEGKRLLELIGVPFKKKDQRV